MTRSGGCHCGEVRYEVEGEAVYHALCHCEACRASSGAPMVGWFCITEGQLRQTSGEVTQFQGTPGAERQFCPRCGTGLFYRNAKMLPGLVDIQSATFDDAAAGNTPFSQLITAAREERLAEIDEEAAATQARVEEIERQTFERIRREQDAQEAGEVVPATPDVQMVDTSRIGQPAR